jgi:hypothetical protein
MRSRLFVVVAAGAALVLSSLPGLAIQTVTIPQPNSDGTTPFQDPDTQAQSKFSTDQQGDTKVDGLGSFHFSVNSDQGWPAGSGYYYRPGYSSQAGYGANNAPNSEFYNSGYPFPH